MDTKEKSLLLGFLDCAMFDGVYRGGCLVTNEDTYPIEFRVTSSIQPTNLQRLLYGEAIIPYIYTELIAIPMTNKLTSELRFVVVEKEAFLSARPKFDMALFYIDKKTSTLRGHVDFPNESKIAQQIQARFSLEKLSEPFIRMQAALAEAHKNKIGDE